MPPTNAFSFDIPKGQLMIILVYVLAIWSPMVIGKQTYKIGKKLGRIVHGWKSLPKQDISPNSYGRRQDNPPNQCLFPKEILTFKGITMLEIYHQKNMDKLRLRKQMLNAKKKNPNEINFLSNS